MSLMDKAIQQAKDRGVELYPSDCIDILEAVYVKRLDIMLPKTLCLKVYDLMGVITDTPDITYIEIAVNDYLNS